MKPDWLKVEDSFWYGKTIRTTTNLKVGHLIAKTNIINYDFIEGYINTPSGKLFNSTDDMRDVNIRAIFIGSTLEIIASRDIQAGEELLLSYVPKC